MAGRVFDCEIQARFRDLNAGWHIDSAEAVRLIDEARIQFLMFAPVFGQGVPLLHRKPDGIVDLMGSHRIDYRAEMRFQAYHPFLLRLWVCHVGRTSFTIATELRTGPEEVPALVAESTMVFFERAAERAWAMSDAVREDLEAFSGPRVGLR
jgi:acyl-CoA thioester hydrolase